MDVPIVIICFNNYKYVENTVNQIYKINQDYYKNIVILNNCSTCIDTINYLENVNCKVINNHENLGPWVAPDCNKHIYDNLPDKFILTDPDLQFNENIPNNFIEILLNLSNKYNYSKIGFALDISDFDKMINTDNYFFGRSILKWESQFWQNRLADDCYELYIAPIDTTFALINKKFYSSYLIFEGVVSIRIAGNFTAKHLPWYKENHVLSIYENYQKHKNISEKTRKISTMSKCLIDYIDNQYLKIEKNSEFFFIEKKEENNLNFWENIYSEWKIEEFDIFNKFLDRNKIFINIGDWIGAKSIYGIRKSKYFYCIEADKQSFNNIVNNVKINSINNNYTLIHKAIYSINDIEIEINDNSYHKLDKIVETNNSYLLKTITLQKFIEFYKINPNEISLININIFGNEEHIMNDLYDIHDKYKIPIYIFIYYDLWKDKNIDRFIFLTEIQKKNIMQNNYILFKP